MEPDAVSRVTLVHFNGEPVDYVKESDMYRTWINVLNLYWTNTTVPGVLDIFVDGVITPAEFCNQALASSTLCEYNFYGKYSNTDDGGAEYLCCPRSATALIERGCA